MSTVPADPIQIAQNFVKYYNDTFNTNRASLVSLYVSTEEYSDHLATQFVSLI